MGVAAPRPGRARVSAVREVPLLRAGLLPPAYPASSPNEPESGPGLGHRDLAQTHPGFAK